MELRNQSTTQPAFVRPHGSPPRGLDMDTRSTMFEGRFGRLFRALPPADFGKNDTDSEALLEKLAAAMVHSVDCPKDGSDDEESGIPALYTYLGQFIDHDLTFDPASILQRQNDPDALTDFRTPRFDLDCIYGRGPDDQPYMYSDDKTLLMGNKITGSALGNAFSALDLARAGNGRAIIGDPRNDENSIVSQFQELMISFHNRYLKEHPGMSFEDVQRNVRFHYQWMITTDFLRRVVSGRVLGSVLPHVFEDSDVVNDPPHLRFYHPRSRAFMPLEFSAAAYRFGHSMVRPGYRLNDTIGVVPIFSLSAVPDGCEDFGETLRGFRPMISSWAIDWARFIDIETRPQGLDGEDLGKRQQRTQLAYKIDPSIVDPLSNLPESVTGPNPGVFRSLSARNLVRGWRMRLPSGQSIARAMGVIPLADNEIVLGPVSDDASTLPSIQSKFPDFANNCPLWAYILAEAAHDFRTRPEHEIVRTLEGDRVVGTSKLGDVGGTIVAETFAGIMFDDKNSFWNVDPLWRPNVVGDGSPFGLREFVRYALEGPNGLRAQADMAPAAVPATMR